jgi:Ca-activated chloride channel family protein
MTISVRAELSHAYSFDSKTDAVFKVTIVGERRAEARGFHHIIMIDTSRSMAGEKIELAKKGAEEYAKRIPSGNTISIVTFSDTVHNYPDTPLAQILPDIKASGWTSLYAALQSTFETAKKKNGPGWILLLTDGEPTDVTKPEAYSQLKVPPGFKMVEFGIGADYKESILKALADASGGTLYHITDTKDLPNLMQENAVSQVAARNITVEFGSDPSVRILNYPGPPVSINALETVARIWGQVQMPAGFNGQLLNVQVSYYDSVDGSKKTVNAPVNVKRAKNDDEYQQGIRSNLVSEFAYYQGLEEYYKQLAAGKFKEATRTMNQLTANAEQTRRTDLIESTKRLAEKQEETLRLGGGAENTNRLLKEAASETTKRARGK